MESNFATHAEPAPYHPRGVLLYGIAEILRSRMCVDLLEAGRVEEFGRLMKISHDGDRVSRPGPDGSYQRIADECGDEYLQRLDGRPGQREPATRAAGAAVHAARRLCVQHAGDRPDGRHRLGGAGRGRRADRRGRPGRLHHGLGAPRQRRGGAQGIGRPAIIAPAAWSRPPSLAWPSRAPDWRSFDGEMATVHRGLSQFSRRFWTLHRQVVLSPRKWDCPPSPPRLEDDDHVGVLGVVVEPGDGLEAAVNLCASVFSTLRFRRLSLLRRSSLDLLCPDMGHLLIVFLCGLAGTGPFFGEKAHFSGKRLAEKMDLSPSGRLISRRRAAWRLPGPAAAPGRRRAV